MILDFFHTAANLKKIPRQGWIDKLSIDNPESVADHTFSMAIMGMIFSDLENYNAEKILKIILLHDLVESITGDIPQGQISSEEKTALENNVMKKILNDLPLSLQKQYGLLWEEYQSNHSKEAKMVHQLDRLEMALQAKIYSNEGHSKEKLDSFFNSAKNEINDPKLLELFTKILDK
ncbi:MAG: HD domain-containing protein [Nitrosarchaeum sp.]|nr:MAG: HD domain-containing protein [Nitrosarchaeum sp.]